MRKYQALILDMDGTLLDSRKMAYDSLTLLEKEYGLQLSEEQRNMAFGMTWDGWVQLLGLPDSAAASSRLNEIVSDMLDRVVLFDGVDSVLSAPIRRGVVTSQNRVELTANLTRFHMAEAFEFTVAAGETPFAKPHPRPLLYCLEQMGLKESEALFVVDSSFDYGCALAAGVDFGLASWGAHDSDQYPEATYVFQRPEEILEYIGHCIRLDQRT